MKKSLIVLALLGACAVASTRPSAGSKRVVSDATVRRKQAALRRVSVHAAPAMIH